MATDDLGRQQVTIYPYQDLTSLNGNQMLLSLYHQGAHNVGLRVVDTPIAEDPGGSFISAGSAPDYLTRLTAQFDVVVEAGTTLFFEKTIADYMDPNEPNRPAIVKVVLYEDTYCTVDTHLVKSQYYRKIGITSTFLFVYAEWDFDISSSTNNYARFSVGLGDNYSTIATEMIPGTNNYRYVILGKLLNNPLGADIIDGDVSKFSVSYEPGLGRDWFTKTESVLNNFLITFAGDGLTIDVSTAEMWVNTTYTTPVAAVGILPPAALTAPAGAYQIDVLGYKYSSEDPATLDGRLVWTSFSFADNPSWDPTGNGTGWYAENHTVRTQAELKTYLHDKRFELVDDQYVVLFLVRYIAGIPAVGSEVMWPDWCVVPNSLVPRIGTVSRYSKVNIPVV